MQPVVNSSEYEMLRCRRMNILFALEERSRMMYNYALYAVLSVTLSLYVTTGLNPLFLLTIVYMDIGLLANVRETFISKLSNLSYKGSDEINKQFPDLLVGFVHNKLMLGDNKCSIQEKKPT